MSFAKKLQTDHPQSWSALPSELAGQVLRRLPSHADRVRFAAVCHHWRFSRQEHCLTPPLPWLAFPDGTFFITLTLPNLSSFCLVDEPVGIINGGNVLDEDMAGPLLQMDTVISLRKVIRCSELLIAAIIDIGPLCTVAYCQPGSTTWLVSGLGSKGSVIDMMFYEGMLYVIDEFNDLLAINVRQDNDNGKLRVSRIERGISYFESYLVESHGALLLVKRTILGICDNDTIGGIKPVGIEFDVCQSDFESRSWVKVSSVGDDQALFLSQSSSQSVDVSQYKLKGDCIYFMDDGSCDWFWKDAPSSCAVYDMRDGQCFFIPLPTGSCKDLKTPAAWLFPQS
ncbi:hypothetical protein VPH35_000507 [Triticum aestivum]